MLFFRVEKTKIPTALKGNEVFVKMEAAPINPADINLIEGTYHHLKMVR